MTFSEIGPEKIDVFPEAVRLYAEAGGEASPEALRKAIDTFQTADVEPTDAGGLEAAKVDAAVVSGVGEYEFKGFLAIFNKVQAQYSDR